MKVARRTFLVALLTLPLAGCGLGLPPAGDYATVNGHVTDAATGRPVQGATVLVNGVLPATTDAAGNFTVTPVPTGAWSYTVTAPNHKKAASTNPPPLTPGEKRDFPIRLSPG
ncbi:MAG: carboxypeptidase regulatory-like domain-containing protein [Candidatus Eremiobacteraeota bacterium]|nr:carboxypeptidase regulatory-like domain-containing protein [Candidatus Eremiobacteraeota bacterium]MBC5803103.1 carboxypeptidase regulatory-like domain-containing protein [Candidatus Eremiobacteraeota bacterium]MBC5820948.1 carboxypeptidase regulatory-like domain-containing protein [Candidatus Eremiobacteraeota bacterium]